MKLNLRNYQAGIDLGTTNSAISILDQDGIQILEIEGGEKLLPSCVYFHPKDGCLTGTSAKNQWANENKNGHKGFKRKMGKDIPFPIQSLKTTLLAEELSGVILKKLQEIFKTRLSEDLHTVVVTVPARFDLKAVDATRIAAMGNYKMNGYSRVKPKKESEYYANFLQVETLMEPIAASLAYGITDSVKENSSWLVFDFGGGTFDAAIVNYIDGHMDVKFHAGHNQLGGHDLDQKMLHYVINKLSEKYDLKNFSTSDKFGTIYNKLLDEIEKIKITLSTEKEAVLVMPHKFKDNRNTEIKEEIVITREDYNREVGPILQRAIDICLKMFKDNNIEPSELEKVLLVGGPTQYPYFREMIKDQLKVEIDTSVDPMTAVATGAAIYGSTRNVPEEVKPEIIEILSQTPSDCRVEIYSEVSTTSKSEIVPGRIILPDDNYDLIDSISISRSDKGWESGKIQVEADGTFAVEVHLKENQKNVFKVNVNGKGGKIFSVTSNEFDIVHGIGTTIDRAPYSLNITVKGNKCVKMIEKDAEYPAEKFRTFFTTEEVKMGEATDEGILYLEITEGESENPDDNIYIGELKIPNEELSRDLPIDTELEVTLEAKSDRTITASCYIPFTTQSFEADITVQRTKEEKNKVIDDFNALKFRYYNVKSDVEEMDDQQWLNKLNELEIDKDIEEIQGIIDEEIESGQINDLVLADSLMKVENILRESKVKLEGFENEYIFEFTKFSLQEMQDNLNDKNGMIGEKIAEWEKQLASFEEEQSPEKVIALNEEKRVYTKPFLKSLFCYYLEGFSLTKQNSFANILNEMKSAVAKAGVSSYSYGDQSGVLEVLMEFNTIIADWNQELKNSRFILLKKYYNKLNYKLREVYDQVEAKDQFPIDDYDKIARISNKYDFFDDPKIVDDLASTRGQKLVLKKAIEFSKAYQNGEIDIIYNKLEEFKESYYIDDAVKGNISSGGGATGPIIR